MFKYETRVRYEDLDADGYVKPNAVIGFMQNTAVKHSAAAGYDVYKMAEMGIAWMVLCWDVRLGRRICWDEALIVCTWPYEFRGSIGKRCFEVRAEDGELLAQADSWWALVRLQDQTMITVDTEMTQRFGIDGAAPFVLRRPKGRAQEVGEAFPVQRFDLDTNGHVNNGRFAEIACAYVPEPSRIRELMIEYKHSGHLGEEIVPSYTIGEDGVYVCLSRQVDGQPYIKMRVSYAETTEGRETI